MADPNLILSSQYPIPSALQLYRIYALLTVRARWVPEAQRNEPAEIQRLIAAGVNPSTANGVGQTPLHVACLWGNHECVKVLIEAGALVTSLFLLPISLNGEILLRRYMRSNGMRSLAHDVV